MKLIVVSSKGDRSIDSICEEAETQGFDLEYHVYGDLLKFCDPVPDFKVDENVALLWRTSLSVNKNFETLLSILIDHYNFKYIFDGKIRDKWRFFEYEDKLFQSYIFKKLNLPSPELHKKEQVKSHHLPIIAKPRLSNGQENFKVKSQTELKKFQHEKEQPRFIFQEFHDLKAEYRVFTLGSKILKIYERAPKIKETGQIQVSYKKEATLTQRVWNQCLKLVKYLECDFCGLDIGETKKGEFVFFEYNISPQFISAEKELGGNIAKEIIGYIKLKVNGS